ncbi:MAG: T9SS type A sorting domain-containing protein, partial [Saprospiraceae bacterium]
QAGAVNLIDPDANISNCVFASNFGIDAGTGGAISVNAGTDNDATVSVINSTFQGNEGELAAGIAQWMESDTGSLVLTLQNNIFQNDGLNYAIEDGQPTVVSNGGNIDHNGSMADLLTHPMDQSEVEVEFVSIDDFDYKLVAGSTAIDAGVAEGATATDIEGFQRDEMPDAGAYEFDKSTSTDEVIANEGILTIFPNPVQKAFTLTLANDLSGEVELQIVSVNGKLLQTTCFEKPFGEITKDVNVAQLAAGNYYVIARYAGKVVMENLVKM